MASVSQNTKCVILPGLKIEFSGDPGTDKNVIKYKVLIDNEAVERRKKWKAMPLTDRKVLVKEFPYTATKSREENMYKAAEKLFTASKKINSAPRTDLNLPDMTKPDYGQGYNRFGSRFYDSSDFKIRLSNITPETTQDDIAELIQRMYEKTFGFQLPTDTKDLFRINIPISKVDRRPRDFANISFTSEELGQQCLAFLNGVTYGTVILKTFKLENIRRPV